MNCTLYIFACYLEKIELTSLGPRSDINLLDVPNLGIPSKILDQNAAFWFMGCFIYIWWMIKQYCNGVGDKGKCWGKDGNDNVEGWEMTRWWQQITRDDMNDNITMETTIVATWDDKALDIRLKVDMDDEGIGVEKKKNSSDGGC